MSENAITAGAVVQLKSGGPTMTVAWTEDRQAFCHWFSGADVKGEKFYLAQLEVVRGREPR